MEMEIRMEVKQMMQLSNINQTIIFSKMEINKIIVINKWKMVSKMEIKIKD